MTTNYHTAITSGAAANAATFNAPLSSLDSAITNFSAGVVARYSANSGTVNDSTVTIIDYSSQQFDPDALVTTGASWKFTAGVTGYYLVTASIIYTASASWDIGDVGQLFIYRDAVLVSALADKEHIDTGAGASQIFLHGTDIVSMTASQYLDIRAYHTVGGSLTLAAEFSRNYVSIARVG